MRHVAIVQVGKSDGDGLEVESIKDLISVRKQLSAKIDRALVHIIAASSKQGRGSAEVFAERLSADHKHFTENDLLDTSNSGGGNATPEEFDEVLHEILSCEEEYVILVAHRDFVAGFAFYIGQTYLHVNFAAGHLLPGHAWMIDCDEKTITKISPEPRTKAEKLRLPTTTQSQFI